MAPTGAKYTFIFFDLSLQNAKVAGGFGYGQFILDEDSWPRRLWSKAG